MSDESGFFHATLFVIYAISLFLAFNFVNWFVIVSFAEICLILCFFAPVYALIIPIIADFLGENKTQTRIFVFAIHIFLALLIHPGIGKSEPQIQSMEQQFKLLRKIHSKNYSPYFSEYLSYSLQEDTRFELKRKNPYLYWLYPPTLALLFWGVVLFLLLKKPKRLAESDFEEEPQDAEAQYKLALSYFLGYTVPQDEKKAAKWFQAAAEQGHVDAQGQLGYAYLKGEGVPQDYAEAYFWSNIASSQDEKFVESREQSVAKLTPYQIENVQSRCKEWFCNFAKRAEEDTTKSVSN